MDPGIKIRLAPGGVRIVQQRPAVAGLLEDLDVADALSRIPTLLPICGKAQRIAAGRAVAAARDEPADNENGCALLLAREQAFAAAWRLAVDWPGHRGKDKALGQLKSVKDATDNDSIARALLGFLPGLEDQCDSAGLAAWIATSDSMPADVLRGSLHNDTESGSQTPPALSSGEDLVNRARSAFDDPAFDPLAPAGAGIEVGPLAMGRHPLLPQLLADARYAPPTLRLLAQLLDTVSIAVELRRAEPEADSDAWNEAEGLGMGRAMTARGPVFHRVKLDAEGRVAEWRVLAPTDWHFAPTGPLARDAAFSSDNCDSVSWLVLGFDPCAPWTVTREGSGNA